MRIRPTVLAIFAVVGLGWMATSAAPQNAQPVPGVGTGVTNVVGTVNVGNTPTVTIAGVSAVTASQQGEWKVAVSNRRRSSSPCPRSCAGVSTSACGRAANTKPCASERSPPGAGEVDGPPVKWVNVSLTSLQEKP